MTGPTPTPASGHTSPTGRGEGGEGYNPSPIPSPVGVVVVAAGESRRMAGVDKIFTPLLGLPLIAHTVEAFEAYPSVGSLVLVLSRDRVELGYDLAQERGWRKVTICQGGPRRQDSVRLGLERLSEEKCSWVAVHDGARPCIGPLLSEGLLGRGITTAYETGAAVAAVPAKDTIKVVSRDGLVEATPPRATLWMVQTPQIFRYDLLLEAHRACQETVTDDASIVEVLGHRVKVFMGSYSNLKVTTPEDLIVAEAILRATKGIEATPHPGASASLRAEAPSPGSGPPLSHRERGKA